MTVSSAAAPGPAPIRRHPSEAAHGARLRCAVYRAVNRPCCIARVGCCRRRRRSRHPGLCASCPRRGCRGWRRTGWRGVFGCLAGPGCLFPAGRPLPEGDRTDRRCLRHKHGRMRRAQALSNSPEGSGVTNTAECTRHKRCLTGAKAAEAQGKRRCPTMHKAKALSNSHKGSGSTRQRRCLAGTRPARPRSVAASNARPPPAPRPRPRCRHPRAPPAAGRVSLQLQ